MIENFITSRIFLKRFFYDKKGKRINKLTKSKELQSDEFKSIIDDLKELNQLDESSKGCGYDDAKIEKTIIKRKNFIKKLKRFEIEEK